MDTRRERLARILNDPDFITTVCDHVANGGTLVGLAKAYDVRFSDLMRHIRSNTEYSKRYEQALADRNEWTVESLTEIITRLKDFDIRRLYDNDGRLLSPRDWPDDIAVAVSSVKSDEVKLIDKTKAIDMLGKHIKYFVEKIEHSGSLKLEDIIIGSYKEDDKA